MPVWPLASGLYVRCFLRNPVRPKKQISYHIHNVWEMMRCWHISPTCLKLFMLPLLLSKSLIRLIFSFVYEQVHLDLVDLFGPSQKMVISWFSVGISSPWCSSSLVLLGDSVLSRLATVKKQYWRLPKIKPMPCPCYHLGTIQHSCALCAHNFAPVSTMAANVLSPAGLVAGSALTWGRVW